MEYKRLFYLIIFIMFTSAQICFSGSNKEIEISENSFLENSEEPDEGLVDDF